jgi:very-short-patch-repair endonuclease
MDRKKNKMLVPLARQLRKEMTKEERHLWYDFLRSYPHRFYRQKILGKYVADFYCAKAKLIVELDGSRHYEEKNRE